MASTSPRSGGTTLAWLCAETESCVKKACLGSKSNLWSERARAKMASWRVTTEPAGSRTPVSGLEYSYVRVRWAEISPKNMRPITTRGGPKLALRALCSSVAKKGALKARKHTT